MHAPTYLIIASVKKVIVRNYAAILQSLTCNKEFPPLTIMLLYRAGFKSTSHMSTQLVTTCGTPSIELGATPRILAGLNKLSTASSRSEPNSWLNPLEK